MNEEHLEPRPMRFAFLTAAVQYPVEGISREEFALDPLGSSQAAIMKWIEGCKTAGADGMQVAASIHGVDHYVPPQQMMDPLASHLPIRTKRDGTGNDLTIDRATIINNACRMAGVFITDLGIFENLLHPNETIRTQVHQHILRGGRAAKMLKDAGCTGVTTFIGRDTSLSMDQNIHQFEVLIVPLLRAYDKMGLILRIENCPMPGWSGADVFIQNIAATPCIWITLARIAKKHGLDHVLRFTYDESHSILGHSRARWVFAILKEAGFSHLIDAGHAKDQNQNPAKIAAHCCYGQRNGLGMNDLEGNPLNDPAKLGRAWGRMNSEHTLPGFTKYNTYAQLMGQQADWMEHQLGLRELGLDPRKTFVVIEHEMTPLRDQDFERVLQALTLSLQYMRAVDAAADAQHRIGQWYPKATYGSYSMRQAHDPLSVLPDIKEVVDRILKIPV